VAPEVPGVVQRRQYWALFEGAVGRMIWPVEYGVDGCQTGTSA
jgi:hypothetical protein